MTGNWYTDCPPHSLVGHEDKAVWWLGVAPVSRRWRLVTVIGTVSPNYSVDANPIDFTTGCSGNRHQQRENSFRTFLLS